jgi:hypothetical protein
MQRRDLLRLLASATLASAMPRELSAFGRGLQSQTPATSNLRTLNAHQNATVTAIAEMIIPQTDTPGAKAARVNEFIDLILTDWYAPPETHKFLDGLANVDTRCRARFGRDFLDCAENQQAEMLAELDADIAAERALHRPGTHSRDQDEKPQHFFYMMKQLTIVGYCTSEAGAQAVGYEVIPTEHGGCLPLAEPIEKARS